MKKLALKVLSICYWFYGFEKDNWMRYYYTIFAFSMFIVFYFWGIAHTLGNILDISVLQIDKARYTIFAFSVIGLSFMFFYRQRKFMEKRLSSIMIEKRDISFYFAVMFIVFSFITCFGSIMYFKV